MWEAVKRAGIELKSKEEQFEGLVNALRMSVTDGKRREVGSGERRRGIRSSVSKKKRIFCLRIGLLMDELN